MDIFEFSGIVAQVSAALIGFSAIVVALISGKNQEFNLFHKRATLFLIGIGMTVLFFSFFPNYLLAFSINETLSWRISNISFSIVLLAGIMGFAWTNYPLYKKLINSRVGPAELIRFIIGGMAIITPIISGIWPGFIPLKGAYMLSLGFMTIGGTIIFFFIVLWFGGENRN